MLLLHRFFMCCK